MIINPHVWEHGTSKCLPSGLRYVRKQCRLIDWCIQINIHGDDAHVCGHHNDLMDTLNRSVALWEHQHVCISMARQTPNGSGRRCPLRVCLPPTGRASCPRPAPASCDRCPTSSTHAYECPLIMCALSFSFLFTCSTLSQLFPPHTSCITALSFSKCSSLVLSSLVLPTEPAIYFLNPAVFLSTRIYFILVFCCPQSEAKAG